MGPTQRRVCSGLALAVALAVCTTSRAQVPAAADALQRGVTLMETRGDCPGALAHFSMAASAGHPDTAARALFLSARCFDRLGRHQEARTAYEQVLTRFATHPLAVQARRRLSQLRPRTAAQELALTWRRVELQGADVNASLSANGRYVLTRDDRGDLVRRDVQRGTTWTLRLADPDQAERIWGYALAPNGRAVAYTWADDQRRGELRVTTADGATPRTLVPAGPWQSIRPLAWTPDGRRLVAITTDQAFDATLHLVDVRSGTLRALQALGRSEPQRITVSPDGRTVLFEHAPSSGPRDIYAIDLATAVMRRVVEHAADDALPVFLPDGRGFLFVSDRFGPLSLWRQAWPGQGEPPPPTLVRRDVGRIWPIAILPNGTFLHGLQTGMVDVHLADLASSSAPPTGSPVSATFAGNNLAPDWSADGQALVYVSTRGALAHGRGAQALVIREHRSRRQRLLHPDMLFVTSPRWSPDGTRLFVKGRAAATNRWGLHLLDARSGAIVSSIEARSVDAESEFGSYQWVPGREALLMARQGVGLVELDLAGGAERLVVPLPARSFVTGPRGCAYAPDGQTLAWSVREPGDGGRPQTVLRVRTADGRVRDVLRTAAPEWLALQAWTPDGRALLVTRQFPAREGQTRPRDELWRVPLDGTSPIFTGLEAPGLRGAVMHPDGHTIAYVSGLPTWEIWAMEGIR